MADGFEIANHSVTHRPMTHLSASELCWEMAECDEYVKQRAPDGDHGHDGRAGRLLPEEPGPLDRPPHGPAGQDRLPQPLHSDGLGRAEPVVGGQKFDSNRIARIGTGPGWVERAIAQLSAGRIPEYVSDGNPDTVAVPRRAVGDVNPHRLEGARLVVYDDGKGMSPLSSERRRRARRRWWRGGRPEIYV